MDADEHRELYAEMRYRIPGLRVGFKDDPPGLIPWHHRLVHGVARRLVPDYDTRFTTVLYPIIYLPAGTRRSFARRPEAWSATFRHELVHLEDTRAHPLLMPLSYVLPPAGLTLRAWWELRAYAQSMVDRRERGLPLDEGYVSSLVELFSGRSYVFMLWPKWLARDVLEHLRGRVEAGEIAGLRGRTSFWVDFVGPVVRGILPRGGRGMGG